MLDTSKACSRHDSRRGVFVLWGLIIVSIIGMLIGLRFRAPALLVATLATIGISVWLMGTSGWSTGATVFAALFLVVVLQCAYLLGLFLKTRQGKRWLS